METKKIQSYGLASCTIMDMSLEEFQGQKYHFHQSWAWPEKSVELFKSALSLFLNMAIFTKPFGVIFDSLLMILRKKSTI